MRGATTVRGEREDCRPDANSGAYNAEGMGLSARGYNKKEFSTFATKYGFTHIKSSLEYPQSNGFAEGPVKILKNILLKAKDSKV